MALRDLVLDSVAALNFKRSLDRPERLARSWVPPDQLRRLAAYKVRSAYLENCGRFTLPDDLPDDDRRAHREYGEPALLVQRVVAGVLGDGLELVVDGADTELSDTPSLPPRPEDPGEVEPLERAAYQAQLRVWEGRARETLEEWERAWAEQPALREHQDWIRSWADSELFVQRVWECEGQTVGLADGVYLLAWSPDAQRAKVRIYDPGFYFPVLDDEAEARGFPTRVHLAWETDEDDDGVTDHVRRITYELGPILPVTDDDGILDGEGLQDGPRQVEDTRRYPWSEEPSATTCYLTDATWAFDSLGDRKVDAFDSSKARYAIGEDGELLNRLDLRIDFLPIIHVPNTPASQEHFGRSLLDRILQLLDDLSDTDSDLQAASSLAGTPMAAVSGVLVPETLRIRPGAIFSLGEKGTMSSIDLSSPVVVLRALVDDLLERLFTNVQVPGDLLGRVSGEVTSGVHLKLRFSPFSQLVGVLRLVREPKYALLLKMVTRLSQAGGVLEPGPTPSSRLRFGAFLPEDLNGLAEMVVQLVQAKVISRATGLRMLVDSGVDVDDISEELDAIASTDFAGAAALLDATGSDDAVFDYLGISQPEGEDAPVLEAAPTLDLPPPSNG